ncbi:MAG: T9SS type A sorting domain-containing protein [Bacteroidetes bacterium]|nr:T9SS type A sorting domain-containing protein [Bacteroidota bacterium]
MKKITKIHIAEAVMFGIIVSFILTIVLVQIFNPSQQDQIIQTEVHSQLVSLVADQSLRFIANEGQAGTDAYYHVEGAGHTVLFHEDKIVLRRVDATNKMNQVVLHFEGANASPYVEGLNKLRGVANFYTGSDPDNWQTNVSTYSSVMYKGLYPGIDMAYIGDDGILESEFYLSPGADYHQIRLNYKGITSRKIRGDGALVMQTALGELVERTPVAYQEIEGTRREVKAQYKLLADANVGFNLGKYDPDYPVVIDPELVFQVTIEPSSSLPYIFGVALDGEGNLILAGEGTRAFPVTDSIPGSNHLNAYNKHGLLLKLDGTSGEVVYSALFGGAGSDHFEDLVLDTAGNIFLTGKTSSTNFPLMNAAQETLGGGDDAFVVILNPEGELTYSTYLGGSDLEWSNGIALDEMGNIYIGGITTSTDFPVIGGVQQQHNGEFDIFTAKFNPAGSVTYATYLGGSGFDDWGGIAVNAEGQATITGFTTSDDFPMSNAYQNTYAGGDAFFDGDLFITRLNSAGNGYIFSTYYGGNGSEGSRDIVIGSEGRIYIAGSTGANDFPIISGQPVAEEDSIDGILICMDNSGQPLYALRTNISGEDYLSGVAMTDSNKVVVVGTSNDSLRIYNIAEGASFATIYDLPAPGFSLNATDLSNGYLAYSGTYRPTDAKKSTKGTQSPGSTEQCGIIHLGERYSAILDHNKTLRITMHTAGTLIVGVDEEGYVTINGESTGLRPPQISRFDIFGSTGDDVIDLSGVSFHQFYNLSIVRAAHIEGKAGDDRITGISDARNYIDGQGGNDQVSGGKTSDDLHGGDGNDIMSGGGGSDAMDGESGSDTSFGGLGDDNITVDKFDFKVEGGPDNDKIVGEFFGKIFSKKSANTLNGDEPTGTVIIADTLGYDTLDLSGNEKGIIFDFNLLNSPQSIDNNGTQVILEGVYEVIIGSDYDDEFTLSPLRDTARHVDGKNGADVLNFISEVEGVVDDGSTITTPGYADVSYLNIETVNLPVASSTGSPGGHEESLFSLGNNFPNPFSYVTTIQYSLQKEAHVKVSIYNITGQLVTILVNQIKVPGVHLVNWNGENNSGTKVGDGTYLYLLEYNGSVATGILVLRR